jgi:hypothetical protein
MIYLIIGILLAIVFIYVDYRIERKNDKKNYYKKLEKWRKKNDR